jgi:hypothetical protein
VGKLLVSREPEKRLACPHIVVGFGEETREDDGDAACGSFTENHSNTSHSGDTFEHQTMAQVTLKNNG